MAWVKVKWINKLFEAFNTRWPGRTKLQDGTIGDTAHQGSASGHNPDDTPGSKPERQDADTVPEVRAADVDARGVPMQQVIDGIIASHEERKRFIYIIFDGWQWTITHHPNGSTSVTKKLYPGSDKHRTHAHFSGHPDSDEDARSFITILGGAPVTTFDSIHNPPWGDGVPRSLAQLLWEMSDLDRYTLAQFAARYPAGQAAAIARIETKLTALTTLLEQVLQAGGGNVDMAVLLAHLDQKLEAVALETRDAVADLGEGGAAQVRRDA